MQKNKYLLLTVFAMLFFMAGIAQPDHQDWDALLQQHVTEDGKVDYNGFLNQQSKLDIYLGELKNNPPTASWKKNEQLAYWINLYNANTVKLIISNWPLKSIMDIETSKGTSAWKIEFVKVGEKTYSLDAVEHEILRKQFDTPLIHFGVNCASISCPVLYNHAYTAGNVEELLPKMASKYINDPKQNIITSPKEVKISQLFDWFAGDFTKDGNLIDFLNRFSKVKIDDNAKISYLEYDWTLNNLK